MTTSYDARIYALDIYRGKRKTTYWVQWSVGGERFKEKFSHANQAKSFRAELETAAKKGEAFDMETGRPASMRRRTEAKSMSWFDFTAAYVDMKWRQSAPTHRKSIADALAPITEAMLKTTRGRPDHAVLRKAMRTHFNANERQANHPADVTAALTWLARNTRPVSDLAKPDVLRQVMSDFEMKLDGKRAATDTIRLRRITFASALDYAATEKKLLADNPLSRVKTSKRKSVLHQVDKRSVANPIQFRTVLREVPKQGRTGKKLVAFFGLKYWAALRPEEASNLALDNLKLPPRVWNQELGRWEVHEWGEIVLEKAAPEVSATWTDSGKRNEERSLKHRDVSETRSVPCSPELALMLYDHIDRFGTSPTGRLFVAERGGPIGSSTYCRVWSLAREAAFTAEVAASPLAKRPYDLRHACVSFWLMLTGDPARVAEWAGHSLHVLLRVYAKVIDGGQRDALQRIADAIGIGLDKPVVGRT